MRLQVIQDGKGNNTGVFIPMEDWDLIKKNYPDVDNLENDIPQWQKQLLDTRLNNINKNPDTLHPINDFFDTLDS